MGSCSLWALVGKDYDSFFGRSKCFGCCLRTDGVGELAPTAG